MSAGTKAVEGGSVSAPESSGAGIAGHKELAALARGCSGLVHSLYNFVDQRLTRFASVILANPIECGRL